MKLFLLGMLMSSYAMASVKTEVKVVQQFNCGITVISEVKTTGIWSILKPFDRDGDGWVTSYCDQKSRTVTDLETEQQSVLTYFEMKFQVCTKKEVKKYDKKSGQTLEHYYSYDKAWVSKEFNNLFNCEDYSYLQSVEVEANLSKPEYAETAGKINARVEREDI